MKNDRLQIIFAHHNEPIPASFSDYAKPQNHIGKTLSLRQIQKWKSQRMAYFLLYKLLQENNLDVALLNTIQKTPSGRPYFEHPMIDFNISHSGEWVAIIFSYSLPKKQVGIDIEHLQKTRRYSALLNYYASQNEINEIQSSEYLPQLSRLESRFYLSWCLREAVLKSQGVGIIKLAEVQHSLSEQIITSPHCPSGRLFFYHQLPFYLAYFIEQKTHSSPPLLEWKNGQFHTHSDYSPIIYQVN